MSDLVNVFDLQDAIADWAKQTFGEDITATRHKLAEEVAELDRVVQTDGSWHEVAHECADVMHLLFQVANHYEFNLIAVTQDKFDINKRRTWGQPDANGVYKHEEEAK